MKPSSVFSKTTPSKEDTSRTDVFQETPFFLEGPGVKNARAKNSGDGGGDLPVDSVFAKTPLQKDNNISNTDTNDTLGLYIHWPFCAAKCPYCDFNSHVRHGVDFSRWEKALLQEIECMAQHVQNKEVVSIFFGGGTPSLMPPSTTGKIIEKIRGLWPTTRHLEITLEANPTSFDVARLKDFKKEGVNRLSLGVQSFNDQTLSFLGRKHNAATAKKALHCTQELFANFSFDMMYGHPHQTLDEWEGELKEAVPFIEKHVSFYQLTYEPGTPFYGRFQKKELFYPCDNRIFSFESVAKDLLLQKQLFPYEISNYAKKGWECRHNTNYWRYKSYLGVGPGAHGRLHRQGHVYSLRSHRAPEIWLEHVEQKGSGVVEHRHLPPHSIVEEMLIMGLRLQEGVCVDAIQSMSGHRLSHKFFENINVLRNHQWLFFSNNTIRPTESGKKRLNQLILFLAKNI